MVQIIKNLFLNMDFNLICIDSEVAVLSYVLSLLKIRPEKNTYS